MSARIDREALLLKELASALDARAATPATFATMPEVQTGLRRFWISITWLDPNHRLAAQLPQLPVGTVALGGAIGGQCRYSVTPGGAFGLGRLAGGALFAGRHAAPERALVAGAQIRCAFCRQFLVM